HPMPRRSGRAISSASPPSSRHGPPTRAPTRRVAMADERERERRWRLALGAGDDQLAPEDQQLSGALTALYGEGADSEEDPGARKKKRRGGLGGSRPNVARWLGDIRRYFPAPVVQIVQKDAFERLGLARMLVEPEFLAAVEADVNLVADLIALRQVM